MWGRGAEARVGPMIARRLQHELQLSEAPAVDCVWQGCAAMTTDFLPHLYEFGRGFIGGIGCNGRGIALTAMLGEVLAEAATGRRWEELPVTKAPAKPLISCDKIVETYKLNKSVDETSDTLMVDESRVAECLKGADITPTEDDD